MVAIALASTLAPAAGAQSTSPDPRAEASALARIALETRAELRAKAPVVAAGTKRLARFSDDCPALERAAKRAPEEDVEALSAALSARFFYAPLLGPLDRFAGTLEAAAVTDRALREGVAGWRRTVESLKAYVRLPTPVCAAVRRWARSGYARARAPADATALATIDRKSERFSDAIDGASRRLRKLGVSVKTAKFFTIDGLFEAAFPDEIFESETETTQASSESADDFAAFCAHNPGAC